MTFNQIWKRVAAAAIALTLVTGYAPANVGGFFKGGTAIVASADPAENTITVTWSSDDITKTTTSLNGVSLDGAHIGSYGYTDFDGKYFEDVDITPDNGPDGYAAFTTELGNITRIEVTGGYTDWGFGTRGMNWENGVWTGSSPSVRFFGNITTLEGERPWKITFTIEPQKEQVEEIDCSWALVDSSRNSYAYTFDGTLFFAYGECVGEDGIYVYNTRRYRYNCIIASYDNVTTKINKVELRISWPKDSKFDTSYITVDNGTVTKTEAEYGEYIVIDNINATHLTIDSSRSLNFDYVKIYYAGGPAAGESAAVGSANEEVISDVTLNTCGGTINSGAITSYTEGTEIKLPANVTKKDYIFGGWYDNSDCEGTAVTAISADAIGTQEFWAKWIPDTFIVTWLGYGGEVIKTAVIPYGDIPISVNVEPANVTEGNYVYVFAGWDEDVSEVTGDVTYTARFDEYEKFAAVEPTCSASGNSEFYIGPDGLFYKIEDGEFVEIEAGSWIIAATGHKYATPVWTWYDDNSAIAKFVCETCSTVDVLKAEVTSDTTAPTFNTEGKTIYTAKVTVDGVEFTDTKEVKIDKLSADKVISYESGKNCVKLTWIEDVKAEKYAVYGYVNGKWQKLDECYDTSYILNDLKSGVDYQVAVIGMFDGQWKMDFSNAITVTPKVVTAPAYPKESVQYSSDFHKIKIDWTKVNGATKYGIAVKLAGKWKVQAYTDPDTTTFTTPKLKPGSSYEVVICAKVDGKWQTQNIASRAFTVNVK